MKKRTKSLALALILSLALTVPAFADSTFAARTYVNGIELDGYTAAAAKEYLEGEFSRNFTMTIKFRNGTTETIKGSDFSYKLSAPNNLETILASQSGQTQGAAGGYTGDGMSATFDEVALRNVLSNLNSVKNAKKTENAYITTEKPYKIVPEVQGNSYNMDKLLNVVKSSLNSGLQSIDLGNYDVLDTITVRSNDLQETLSRLNQVGDMSVTLNVLGHKETVDSSRIMDWMTGVENGKLTLDQSKVAAYVAEIANRYDDAGNTQTFHSASGKDVVMSTTYGVHINQAATVTALTDAVAGLQTTEIEPVYTCKPVRYDMPQFGDTFAEVDLTLQHVYFYQDKQCVWDSDCVSGLATDPERATPTGVFSLTYKQKDKVLRGKLVNGKYSYESPVSYWMPFNGGIGFHDATWRSKFGGTIYQSSGSHGCINLPKDKAAALYNLINKGTIVVVHY